jgi:beta-glucosidase
MAVPFEARDVESKVNALLAKMTLEEKIGQLNQLNGFDPTYVDLIRQGRIGSILNEQGAAEVNRIQKIAIDSSRLRIPILFGLDVIHGYRTIFPIPLAEAATWNPVLVERAARVAAVEASASGIRWTFAPMVDIARDPRWGRIAEGSGEDTYLGSAMAAARVRGFQGERLDDPRSVAACAKHFAAYGAAEGGRDYNTTDMSEKTLREIFLPPFHAALNAGAATFMCAFNELNGTPCSGNRFLLTEVLRGEWGFRGFVVSDWNSIREMLNHGVAEDPAGAAAVALTSGVDMDMMSSVYLPELPGLVRSGKVPEAAVDEAVRRVLRVKFKLGLFDRPYTDTSREGKELLASEHREAAVAAAREAIVLLKNDGGILPLKKNIRRLAVIGPLADDADAPLGCWACDGRPEDVVTVLSGIRGKLTSGTELTVVKGCEVDSTAEPSVKEAVDAAIKADAVIIVAGENRTMSGEAYSRSDIGLPGRQEELIRAVATVGKPLVVVLMSGRPLAIPWISEHVPAIVEAWQLGTECGHAVADVLFGDVNPSGRLNATFPRVTGQVPIYYNHKNTGRPSDNDVRYTSKYFDLPVTPQYPFGWGLSYTRFEYGGLEISGNAIRPDGKVKIGVVIKNAGSVPGREVVQLYVRDLVGSMGRPVKELRGFQKIALAPGESKTVEFELGPAELGFYNRDLKWVVEPGAFQVWIAPNSADEGVTGRFEVRE